MGERPFHCLGEGEGEGHAAAHGEWVLHAGTSRAGRGSGVDVGKGMPLASGLRWRRAVCGWRKGERSLFLAKNCIRCIFCSYLAHISRVSPDFPVAYFTHSCTFSACFLGDNSATKVFARAGGGGYTVVNVASARFEMGMTETGQVLGLSMATTANFFEIAFRWTKLKEDN